MLPFYNEYNHPRPPSSVVDRPQLGLGVPPQDNLPMPTQNANGNCVSLWEFFSRNRGRDSPEKKPNKRKFELNIDVQQYKPQDVSVKTANRFVVVEARHGERKDQHGFVSRGFSRRYQLPESIDPCFVISSLSSDGILNITAPLRVPPRSDNERSVPIVRTGPVRTQLAAAGQ